MSGVSGTAEEERLGEWERRLEATMAYLPYLAWGVSVVLAVMPFSAGASPGLVLPLALATLLWLALRTALDRHADRLRLAERPWITGAHFSVLLALIFQLVFTNPVFGFFAFSGYVQAMRYLTGRRRAVAVAATAVATSLSQIGGRIPTTATMLGVFGMAVSFNLAVVGVIVTLTQVTELQSRRRKQANAALSLANERLTALLAENAGLQAQLLTQAREAGVTDERQRMAREIHDTVAQGLAGIVTQLQAADQARSHGGTDLVQRRHLDNAARLARDSLADARRAVRALRPAQLEEAELPTALTEAVGQWRELHGATAGLTVTGDAVPLHPEVEITLLRAAQEALANVGKYAGADRVGLTLSYMEDVVTLDVRDDGVGFDPATLPEPGSPDARGAGFGLTAMGHRVRRLSGRLEVESEPGGGTALSVTLPAIPRGGHDD
ncbi:sensor histidine kinase [Streptantibioticus parmotrematis]|uniref:sensor histidine kinase n=1 Tax=Streptantibioticus parmotrematis TaxID=2873249 RepID=UPI00340974B6